MDDPRSFPTTSTEYRMLTNEFAVIGSSIIDAAGDSDPAVLNAILERAQSLREEDRLSLVVNCVHDETHPDGDYWDTPLLRAIACQRTANIQNLLRQGANPNGIDSESLAEYARRFRRVRFVDQPYSRLINPVCKDEVGDAKSQLYPLTSDELSTRASTTSRFWTGTWALPLDAAPNGDRLHSLVMAARTTPQILDTILSVGADVTCWKDHSTRSFPEEADLTPSSLCVSTPLHGAIDADNITMLSALLDRGFNPNAQALIIGSQALTPMQHAIATGKIQAYRTLASRTTFDPSIVTPSLKIHELHFAVAQLRTDLLDIIGTNLSIAPVTALGHTLLHVVCLPLDDTHIQLFAPKVRESLHDVRTLDLNWGPTPLARRTEAVQRVSPSSWPGGTDGPPGVAQRHDLAAGSVSALSKNELMTPPVSTIQLEAQSRMVQRLVSELDIAEAEATDIYDNTPLHYLAGARITNDELIIWLRQFPCADEVWRTAKNRWGWTPADLWVDNVTTIEPGRASKIHEEGGLVDYSGEDSE